MFDIKTFKKPEQPSVFAGRTLVRYEHSGSSLRRIVWSPDGAERISEIPNVCGVCSGDPHADFDLCWLCLREKPAAKSENQMRGVDLFAGCGGVSVGLSEAARAVGASFQSVGAVDFEPSQSRIFRANHPGADVRCQDICEIFPGDVGEPIPSLSELGLDGWRKVDFLTGGPPCQGHSSLNNHTRGVDDRNLLALKMARAAEMLRPKFVVVENVPGVEKDTHRAWFKMSDLLEKVGYRSVSYVLRAEMFGVAQARKRVFLFAWRTDMFESLGRRHVEAALSQVQTTERPIEWALQRMPRADYSNRPFDRPPTLGPQTSKRIRYLFENDSINLPDHLRPDCHRLKDHGRPHVYGRMRPGRPAPTITTGYATMSRGRFVHPHEPRMLTPHEAARIQFFPDWFEFGDLTRTGYYLAIGNAVPPKMGYVAGLTMMLAAEIAENRSLWS